jgi:alkanesulfonate monooxygenase SsuD/methylene tetrahydromethanopterin reductase-like flavin-dependent oxidoreductase (luciferase family)
MQRIWTEDEAEFHGEFVDFEPIWSWPKPLRVPPILIGGGGPTVLDRVLEYGDGWVPLRVPASEVEEFAGRIDVLQRRAADAGRDRIPVTLYGAAAKPAALESYERAGVDRVRFELPDADRDTVLRTLDDLAALRD